MGSLCWKWRMFSFGMMSVRPSVLLKQVDRRWYARGHRRRPVRVLTAEENTSQGISSMRVTPSAGIPSPRSAPMRHPAGSVVLTPGVASDIPVIEKFQLPSDVKYEKLEEGDKRFGPVIMACKNRKMRSRTHQILLEGKRLIQDAIQAGTKIKSLYFSKIDALDGLPLDRWEAKLYKVPYKQMSLWSDVVTPSGLIAVCEKPSTESLMTRAEALLPLTLICDNMRDPGNMGTLLRSAVAVGCKRVLVTKGCVDIWDPKVLRSGAGAHFRLHIIPNLGWQHLGNYISPQSSVFLADSASVQKPFRVSNRTMKQITEIEHTTYTEVDEESNSSQEVDPSYLDKDTVALFKNFPLVNGSYTNVDYTNEESVVVIGGETHGLSPQAHKFAFDRNGEKIHIPMSPRVDSLNASMAATIIMFEIKRQLVQKTAEDNISEQSSGHA